MAERERVKYKNIMISALEAKLTMAENGQQNEIWITLDVMQDVIELLKEQPQAKCHWVKMTGMMPPEYHGHYGCSNCGWHGIYSERELDYKFCPACGADMRG